MAAAAASAAPAAQDLLDAVHMLALTRVWSETHVEGVGPAIEPGHWSDAVEGWQELTNHYHVAEVIVRSSRLVMHEMHDVDPSLSEYSTLTKTVTSW